MYPSVALTLIRLISGEGGGLGCIFEWRSWHIRIQSAQQKRLFWILEWLDSVHLKHSISASILVSGLRTSLYDMHIYRTTYILGLQSSWGTSRVHPSWSHSRHILTPALSPFLRARVRSHACPEEVVYSLNDSCSHFPQCLFPPNVPYQPTLSNLL
jgi:hypothetical protein